MAKFYLNKDQQPSGDYEVHAYGCAHGAIPENQIYLGEFMGCANAVAEAKRRFPNVAHLINGCYYCCNPCHTS